MTSVDDHKPVQTWTGCIQALGNPFKPVWSRFHRDFIHFRCSVTASQHPYLTMYRLVYLLGYLFWKNYHFTRFWYFFNRISESGLVLYVWSGKITPDTEGDTPDRAWVVDEDSRWHRRHHQKSWISWTNSKSVFCRQTVNFARWGSNEDSISVSRALRAQRECF